MLITPAMASEPYWDAAPSRSTSIRLIAWTGIARKSVPVVPSPWEAITLGKATPWRRLPLTSTSTWSALIPRSVATWSAAPSPPWKRVELKEGAIRPSASAKSTSPSRASSSAP